MHSQFGFLSYEISHCIRQRFNKAAEDLGITHSQWRVLVHLANHENCRQIELAERLDIKPITLVRQIDFLEEAGLIRRNKDTEDRRAYRLEILPEARTVMEQLWVIADRIEAEVLAILSASEQESLVALLGRVKHRLNLTLPPAEGVPTEPSPP